MNGASLMHEAGHTKLVLWDNPEGWSGEGEGMVVHDGRICVDLWLIHVDVWQKKKKKTHTKHWNIVMVFAIH